MPTEQFSNNAVSTLNGAITGVATTLVVTSATPYPVAPQFRILIDTEIMLVTGVAGTTFTVTRGAEGTAPSAHGNGASVRHVLTAGALEQLKLDAGGGGGSDPLPTVTRVWHVAVNGNDGTGTGTENNPLLTVQAAITAALASPGAVTIAVGPGTFTANFAIPRGFNFRGTKGTIFSGGTLTLDTVSVASWLTVTGSSSLVDIEIHSYPNINFGGAAGAGDSLDFERCYLNVTTTVPIVNVFGTPNSSAHIVGTSGINPHYNFKKCRFAAGSLMIRDMNGTLEEPVFDQTSDTAICIETTTLSTYNEVLGGWDGYRGVQISGSVGHTVEMQGFVCTSVVQVDGAVVQIPATADFLAGNSPWSGNLIQFSGGATASQVFPLTPASGISYDDNLQGPTTGSLTTQGIIDFLKVPRNIHTPDVTSAYVILATEGIIPVDSTGGSFIVSLPALATLSETHTVTDVTGQAGANPVTLDGNGNNISGAPTFLLSNPYDSVTVVCTGVAPTRWSVV